MSYTFRLVCKETGKSIWIGQGRSSDIMSVFYSDQPETMRNLARFLRDHYGKALVLDDDGRGEYDWCPEYDGHGGTYDDWDGVAVHPSDDGGEFVLGNNHPTPMVGGVVQLHATHPEVDGLWLIVTGVDGRKCSFRFAEPGEVEEIMGSDEVRWFDVQAPSDPSP